MRGVVGLNFQLLVYVGSLKYFRDRPNGQYTGVEQLFRAKNEFLRRVDTSELECFI